MTRLSGKGGVCINYGGGVNSTAILAMLCAGKFPDYEEPLIAFADTGAERPKTYEYLQYIKPIVQEYGYEIRIVQSSEGSLLDYCKEKAILPMRHLRWCTDRWKRKPLDDLRDGREYNIVIGIDAGEAHRANRWLNDPFARFPLIQKRMDRVDCIDTIKDMGWHVPVKSGCWFCPYEHMDAFKELKQDYPELFDSLCEMEQKTLVRLKDMRQKGWYDAKRPLKKAVEKRYPELCEGQMCLYCFG